jgi:hypothetical protein
MPTMLRRRDLLATASALALVVGPAVAGPPPSMTLYKTPDCGCCEGYADYLRAAGFTVLTKPTNELSEISRRAGVPSGLEGCHTTLVGDYVVEGHVPVEAIHKLLAERPAIKGISLPGMPDGSPGMSGTKTAPFTVYAIGGDGQPSVFATI